MEGNSHLARRFSKMADWVESLRDELTVLSGFSHPRVRSVHGHNNADQFLTAAATGKVIATAIKQGGKWVFSAICFKREAPQRGLPNRTS